MTSSEKRYPIGPTARARSRNVQHLNLMIFDELQNRGCSLGRIGCLLRPNQNVRLLLQSTQIPCKPAATFQDLTEQDRRAITVRDIETRPLPIAAFWQRCQRIPIGDDSILSQSVPRHPTTAGEMRRERRVERCAVYAGLAAGDYFFEWHAPGIFTTNANAVYRAQDEMGAAARSSRRSPRAGTWRATVMTTASRSNQASALAASAAQKNRTDAAARNPHHRWSETHRGPHWARPEGRNPCVP